MGAIISECGLYRYRLERDVDLTSTKVAAIIMVNPSTADAVTDDATIRKVIGFCTGLRVRRVIVGNKFAFRAKDIKALRTATDPVGPDNNAHLEQIMRDADLHIVAWGRLEKLPSRLRERWREIVRLAEHVGCSLHSLSITNDGHPGHPLMLSYDRPLMPWTAPRS